LDTSFHRLEDLKAFEGVRVLGVVPQVLTKTERSRDRRRQYYRAVAFTCVLLAVFKVSCQVASGNEQLVRFLVKPASGTQLR
jgi:hypothetical protein